MPRRARAILPNIPHHIVQRGHSRNTVFREHDDFQHYLDNLREWKLELGVKVYSYCLMTNHVHLVVEPGDDTSTISQLMKQLAARQTRRINKQEGRSGSLWEDRYRSSPIQRDNYLLQCCRYVERNPVKAGMVEQVRQYPWSSYLTRIGEAEGNWLDFEQTYLALGQTAEERQSRYRQFVNLVPEKDETELIRTALSRSQLTGNAAFIEEVEQRTGCRIEVRSRGRPKKGQKI